MKKLLLFAYNLNVGGAEKELINVIKLVKSKCEIHLVLIKKEGILLSELPDNVIIHELKKNIIDYIFFRFLSFYRKLKINKIVDSGDYCCAVAYIEGRACTWVSDIKKDIYKLAWVHNDVGFSGMGITDKEAKKSYKRMNKIICVSNNAKINFCKRYGVVLSKVEVIYNYINRNEIIRKSEKFVVENKTFTFVNVAKMRKEKRQDRLIEAARDLKRKGYSFKVQIVGDGPEFNNIKNMIYKLGVNDCVELLGFKDNPYPYMKCADVFVLSSESEAYGLVVKEALLLKTKVLVTRTSGPIEILENGKYGLICNNDLESLIKLMEKILLDNNIYKEIEKNIDKYVSDELELKEQIINILHL